MTTHEAIESLTERLREIEWTAYAISPESDPHDRTITISYEQARALLRACAGVEHEDEVAI